MSDSLDTTVTERNVTKKSKQISSLMVFKLLSLILAIALLICLKLWQPWQANIKASDRTISVTGDATVKATPDEYTFNEVYQISNSDPKAALAEVSTKEAAIVDKLKALGVSNSAIKTSTNGSSGYDYYLPVSINGDTTTYSLSIEVILDSNKLVQVVQDYLLTTTPTGTVSPDATFSSAKQKALQQQARTLAEKDARSKADQTAQNLGFKVAAVKSVDDSSLATPEIFNGLKAATSASSGGVASAPSLSVQPGQNDLSYSVTVVYFIK